MGRKWIVSLLLLAASAFAADQHDDVVMRAMKDELARSMAQLRLEQMEKPYFIAYRMQEVTESDISATLGSLTTSSGTPSRNRLVGVELRVGDYAFDNSNFISMQHLRSGAAAMFSGVEQGSLDDNYAQVRREFWMTTDKQYKRALEDLSAKKAALKMRNGGADVPDFSKAPASTFLQPVNTALGNLGELESLARDLSSEFRSVPEVDRSWVKLTYRNVYTRYVNSEGTSYSLSEPLLKLEVSASAQAADGLPISDSFTVYGRLPADLPVTGDLRQRVQKMANLVVKLRSAAVIEHYNGPVLFEGPAAGEIFLQKFGPQLAASRSPMSDNPQFEMIITQMLDRLAGTSFQDKIGARVLPDFISVRDVPSLSNVGGVTLMGSAPIDDDGVKTRDTSLIEHGILKNLLTSRVPVRGMLESTGSRHGWGAAPSNLIIQSDRTSSDEDLRKELLRRAKERGIDYAIVVRHLGGGAEANLLEMARQMSQQGASNSVPEVYKVYLDGHEEPLRGLHIADLAPESFKEIIAAGNHPRVYTDELIPRMSSLFSMGLSSRSDLPVVSCVTPSLLFEEITLAKTEGPFPALPISKSPLAEK